MSHRNRRRIGTVLLAPVVALGAWALVEGAGVDLVVSSEQGTVAAADVLVAALVGALAGWTVVLWLERHSPSPRRHWTWVATTALSVSIVGPSWVADGASVVALIGLHLVTAIVVIAGYGPTLAVNAGAAGRDSGLRRLREAGDPAQ